MSTPQAQEPDLSRPYSSAIAFATANLLVAILIIPPLIQHFRNRNIGATVLVASIAIANFFNFLNAVIWPNDDVQNWFSGAGLCDVEVKFFIMIQVLFPASMACILRALAKVLDTDSAGWMRTSAQRRRAYAIDIFICVFLPSLQMLFHYIVQPQRYYIYGVSGCVASSDSSWLALVLILLPPLIWAVVDAFYAVLIIIRLLKYRLTFNALLANSNTNKSRFLRLYLICCISILAHVPIETYIFLNNRIHNLLPYSWNATHHPTDYSWNSSILVKTDGKVLYDRIIWLAGGILIFCFFGFGRDAFKMYREALLAIGMGRIFPSLKEGNQSTQHRASITGTINSISSKARLYFKRKDTNATFTSSMTSTFDSCSPSSKKMTLMESIREGQKEDRRLKAIAQPMQQEKGGPLSAITSIFSRKQQKLPTHEDPFILTNVTGNNNFLSSVTAEPVSPKHIRSQSVEGHEVLVRKEVRQASETAETLPSKAFEGV